MAVARIEGVVVVVNVGSPGVVMDAAKYVITVETEATPIAPPLIRRAL